MKAIICSKYGPPEVLQLEEVAKPTVKDNEVLIKIHATTVTSGDARIRGFNVPPLPWLPFRLIMGWTGPRNKILGTSLAGEIEEVGKDVKLYRPGDHVFGSSNMRQGCYAEYICLPEDAEITTKPQSMTYEQAAALFFGGHTALHFLKKGNIQAESKSKSPLSVLIYGASGCLGTYAVQLAKYYGAEVIGVCGTDNIGLVKSLGANQVIDYTKTDFTKSGETYDIIFDTVGKSPFMGSVRSLKTKGVYLRSVHMTLKPLLQGLWITTTTSKKVIGGVAGEEKKDLIFLKDLVESGHIKPFIDRMYPLEQIVEAHKYVDRGHKKGSVVITVNHDL